MTVVDPHPNLNSSGGEADPSIVNVLRILAMDAVQQANSGHPGMPMGMAEIAEVLWRRHLRHNPANPQWPNRDRFVLSNGHGSMLLYSLLHLTGYDLPIEELKRFRQFSSRTPGHPEMGMTPGVETTTGPLGQGLANAVGMALAERLMAGAFNQPGHEIVDHHTYVFLGDGCLMEGISHEACSLAGTLGLGKLICFYDDNGISIDGSVGGWFTDDTPGRFRAYGWQVLSEVDGHDSDAVERALLQARSDTGRPTLICCKTVIGKGAPTKAGSHDVHGAPLGKEEVAAARRALGWDHAPFEIPQEIYRAWDGHARGAEAESQWNARFEAYAERFPALAREFLRRVNGALPNDWKNIADAVFAQTAAAGESVATRKASQNVLERLAPHLPELIGGSADLTGSNLTNWSGSRPVGGRASGNYLHFGVREFAMTAICNGMLLHGGVLPYCGTFLTFSDYSRNGLRMSALMRLGVIFVFTHDSIGLGEDGPTHQPIEHATSLRIIPNMDVWRPCDALETAVAWIGALERRTGPTSLLLSRQSLPFQVRSSGVAAEIHRGGYILKEPKVPASAVLIATGSEVAVAVAASDLLAREGIAVRVVSMPSTSAFDRQPDTYRTGVIPPHLPAVAVEAGSSDLWRKYVGRTGAVIGIDSFGESAPAPALFEHFGITAERVADTVRRLLAPGSTGATPS